IIFHRSPKEPALLRRLRIPPPLLQVPPIPRKSLELSAVGPIAIIGIQPLAQFQPASNSYIGTYVIQGNPADTRDFGQLFYRFKGLYLCPIADNRPVYLKIYTRYLKEFAELGRIDIHRVGGQILQQM